MSVSVQEADFDVGAEIARLRAGDPKVGAVASFVGAGLGVALSPSTVTSYNMSGLRCLAVADKPAPLPVVAQPANWARAPQARALSTRRRDSRTFL